MKQFAKLLCIVLVILLMFTGCSQNKKPNDPAKFNDDTVVCRVNGTDITRGEFKLVFDYYNQYYSSYMEQYGIDTTSDVFLNEVYTVTFNALIQSEVNYQKAAEMGISLSDEEVSKIERDAQDQCDAILLSLEYEGEMLGEEDPKVYADQRLDEMLQEQGMTRESYLLALVDNGQKTLIYEKLQDALSASFSISEDEVKAAYDAALAEQTAAYQETPAAFETAQKAYDSGAGLPPVYVPGEYRRVKHVLIKTDSRDDDAAQALANDIYERAASGEDFDFLMAEYGEDSGMKAEPNMSKGYLMNENTSFAAEFLSASLALENVGDVTEPVKTSHGYHVIKLVEIIPSGVIAYDDIKDEYTQSMINASKSELMQQQTEKWVQEAKVERFDDRVVGIGKPDTQGTPEE